MSADADPRPPLALRTRVVRGLVLVAFAGTGCERLESVTLTPEQAARSDGLGVQPPVPGPYWMPERADVDALDGTLRELLAGRPTGRCPGVANHLGDYIVQYAGFTDDDGIRRIYVNGIDARVVSRERAQDALFVAGGGGSSFWQAVYDPHLRTLVSCQINDAR